MAITKKIKTGAFSPASDDGIVVVDKDTQDARLVEWQELQTVAAGVTLTPTSTGFTHQVGSAPATNVTIPQEPTSNPNPPTVNPTLGVSDKYAKEDHSHAYQEPSSAANNLLKKNSTDSLHEVTYEDIVDSAATNLLAKENNKVSIDYENIVDTAKDKYLKKEGTSGKVYLDTLYKKHDATKTYKKDDEVIASGAVYKAKSDINVAKTFDFNDWELLVGVPSTTEAFKPNHWYRKGDLYEDKITNEKYRKTVDGLTFESEDADRTSGAFRSYPLVDDTGAAIKSKLDVNDAYKDLRSNLEMRIEDPNDPVNYVKRLFVSDPSFTNGAGTNPDGRLQIYKQDNTTSKWVLEHTVLGTDSGKLGSNICVNKAGTAVFVSESNWENANSVRAGRVHKLNLISGSWSDYNTSVKIENPDNVTGLEFGEIMDCDDAGSTLVLGIPLHNNSRGLIRYFRSADNYAGAEITNSDLTLEQLGSSEQPLGTRWGQYVGVSGDSRIIYGSHQHLGKSNTYYNTSKYIHHYIFHDKTFSGTYTQLRVYSGGFVGIAKPKVVKEKGHIYLPARYNLEQYNYDYPYLLCLRLSTSVQDLTTGRTDYNYEDYKSDARSLNPEGIYTGTSSAIGFRNFFIPDDGLSFVCSLQIKGQQDTLFKYYFPSDINDVVGSPSISSFFYNNRYEVLKTYSNYDPTNGNVAGDLIDTSTKNPPSVAATPDLSELVLMYQEDNTTSTGIKLLQKTTPSWESTNNPFKGSKAYSGFGSIQGTGGFVPAPDTVGKLLSSEGGWVDPSIAIAKTQMDKGTNCIDITGRETLSKVNKYYNNINIGDDTLPNPEIPNSDGSTSVGDIKYNVVLGKDILKKKEIKAAVDYNVFIGNNLINSGDRKSTLQYNIVMGNNCFTSSYSEDPNMAYTIAIGNGVGQYAYNQTDGTKPTFASSILIGQNSGQYATDASSCTYVGSVSGYRSFGNHNSAFGSGSLAFGGHYENRFSTKSSHNVAMGHNAGYHVYGNNNTFLGSEAGFYTGYAGNRSEGNVVIGRQAAYDQRTMNNSVIIGYNACYSSSYKANSNCVVIGYDARPYSSTINNEVILGNSSIQYFRCNAGRSSLSDARDKTDIKELPVGLDYINALKPVKYKWDYREEHYTENENGELVAPIKDGTYEAGFTAQNLKEVQDKYKADYLKTYNDMPADYDEDGNPLEGVAGIDILDITQEHLLPVAIKAIQELSAKVDSLEKQLAKSKKG